MITKEQITFKNVKAFIQGYYRYYMYTWFKTKLLREHIVNQYETRLNSVDKKCLNDGQCKLCGCAVPQLLWADKACDKPCYPHMMNKSTWEYYKKNFFMPFHDEETDKFWTINLKSKTFKKWRIKCGKSII